MCLERPGREDSPGPSASASRFSRRSSAAAVSSILPCWLCSKERSAPTSRWRSPALRPGWRRVFRGGGGRLYRPRGRMPGGPDVDRAQRAITNCSIPAADRTPAPEGHETEVAVDAVAPGDVLLVRPGERIAADGTVHRGRTAVDQSILTGESLPVDVGPGDRVFTGSINQFGQLEIQVEQVGSQTTMGRVIELLTEAQKHKAPLERTADRLVRRFLPAVLAATCLSSWPPTRGRLGLVPGRNSPAIDVMPALAVLVVACPCGLILATPAAVLAATARLARLGVLVKSGAALERLAQVDAIALDKTGTLTEGRPELGDRVALPPWNGESSRHRRRGRATQRASLARLLVVEAARSGTSLPAAGGLPGPSRCGRHGEVP